MTAQVRLSPADLRRAAGAALAGLAEATIDDLAAAMARLELAAGTILVT